MKKTSVTDPDRDALPIRLDDTMLRRANFWAAQPAPGQRRLQGWKEHDSYQATFTRLLQDRKPKEEGGE